MYTLERNNVQKQVASNEEAARLVKKGFEIVAQDEEPATALVAEGVDIGALVREEIGAQMAAGAGVEAVAAKVAELMAPKPEAEQLTGAASSKAGDTKATKGATKENNKPELAPAT